MPCHWYDCCEPNVLCAIQGCAKSHCARIYRRPESPSMGVHDGKLFGLDTLQHFEYRKYFSHDRILVLYDNSQQLTLNLHKMFLFCLMYCFKNYFVFAANAPGLVLACWFNLAASKLLFKQQFAKLPVSEDIREIEFAKLPAANDLEEGAESLALAAEGTPLKRSVSDKSNETAGSDRTPPMLAEIPVFYTAPKHDYLIMGMIVLWVAVMALIGYANSFSNDTRILIVGIVTNLNLVFFYGAPLSTIATILKSKNTATIHIPTMLTNTISSVFWGVYGLAVLDFFIFVPNALGSLLGFSQVALYLIFPREESIVVPVITAAAPDMDENGRPCDGDATGVVQLQLHEINLEGMTINVAENTCKELEPSATGNEPSELPSPQLLTNNAAAMVVNESIQEDDTNMSAIDRHPLTVNFAEESNTNVVTATSVIHRRLPSENVENNLTVAFATLPEAFGFGGISTSGANSTLGLHRRTSSSNLGLHRRTSSSNRASLSAAAGTTSGISESDLPTEANTRHQRVLSTGGPGS